MQLWGVEEATIEVEGTIPEAAARRLLGDLPPEPAGEGRARVGLLVFRMRGLKPRGLPAPGSDYQEALYRVGARLGSEPAWLCPACDIDRAHVRALGAWLVRYPVAAARIALDAGDDAFRLDMHAAGARLALTATPRGDASPPPRPPRRALVRSGGGLYEIPWREDPGPFRCRAAIAFADDARARAAFDLRAGEDLAWEPEGLILRGRTHRCGLARPR